MTIKTLFVLDYSGPVYTLDDAVERALESGRALEWDACRHAEEDDIPDYTQDVVYALGDWLAESETLTCYDGGPSLHHRPSPERDALHAALAAYVRAHVDLSDAALQTLGWGVLIHPDGRVEWPPIQQALLDCARAWWGADLDVEFAADGIASRHNAIRYALRDDGAWAAWEDEYVGTPDVSVAFGATAEDALRALVALAPESGP